MKQRRIGKNGPLVDEVGFGAMGIAGAFGPADPETSRKATISAAQQGSAEQYS